MSSPPWVRWDRCKAWAVECPPWEGKWAAFRCLRSSSSSSSNSCSSSSSFRCRCRRSSSSKQQVKCPWAGWAWAWAGSQWVGWACKDRDSPPSCSKVAWEWERFKCLSRVTPNRTRLRRGAMYSTQPMGTPSSSRACSSTSSNLNSQFTTIYDLSFVQDQSFASLSTMSFHSE